jgi:hypothetical protein
MAPFSHYYYNFLNKLDTTLIQQWSSLFTELPLGFHSYKQTTYLIF